MIPQWQMAAGAARFWTAVIFSQLFGLGVVAKLERRIPSCAAHDAGERRIYFIRLKVFCRSSKSERLPAFSRLA